MGISIFPSTAAEFVSNNFVVDMNDSTNNTADAGGVKQAGPYSMSFSSGDTSFDVYLIDEDGASVGYSNSTSITASGLFSTVVILGVATDEVISFTYQGSVNNADGEGDEPGAGAYLESISPFDLPSIDDTATVIGGNFGTLTTIQFVSGTAELEAKNITVTNGTSLIVTRPDGLVEDLAPYDLRAINTGVTPPTGTNAHILAGTVTAGSDPTWVTTSPLSPAAVGSSFTQTLEATDSDGTVVDYSVTAGTITPGLTLNSSTGVLSGTASSAGTATFTVTATDDGGNTTAREFTQEAGSGISGGSEFTSGGFEYHLFTSSDDLTVFESTEIEYLIVAGGGGGGSTTSFEGGGGGGAGGLLSGTVTASPAVKTITIGAGGAEVLSGSNSLISGIGTAIGGGGGSRFNNDGLDGGSGGGAARFGLGGTGTAGQGFDGGDGDSGGNGHAAGGGGATAAGSSISSPSSVGDGGDGSNAFATWATAVSLVFDGGFFAGGGGGGGTDEPNGSGGSGGGADGGTSGNNGGNGSTNSGGGGGGGGKSANGGSGGSGMVIVRYAS